MFDYMYISAVWHVKRFIMLNVFSLGLAIRLVLLSANVLSMAISVVW